MVASDRHYSDPLPCQCVEGQRANIILEHIHNSESKWLHGVTAVLRLTGVSTMSINLHLAPFLLFSAPLLRKVCSETRNSRYKPSMMSHRGLITFKACQQLWAPPLWDRLVCLSTYKNGECLTQRHFLAVDCEHRAKRGQIKPTLPTHHNPMCLFISMEFLPQTSTILNWPLGECSIVLPHWTCSSSVPLCKRTHQCVL